MLLAVLAESDILYGCDENQPVGTVCGCDGNQPVGTVCGCDGNQPVVNVVVVVVHAER